MRCPRKEEEARMQKCVDPLSLQLMSPHVHRAYSDAPLRPELLPRGGKCELPDVSQAGSGAA